MSLLLRNVTLPEGDQADVLLDGALISRIGQGIQGGRVLDLSGYLLLPSLAEPHAHLDKAFTADRVPNPSGDLGGAIKGWIEHRPGLTVEDIYSRAMSAVGKYVAHGVTALRTHVDIGPGLGLRALEAISAVRASVAAVCEIQIVAFSATPLSGAAGAANRDLLAQALAEGADVAGACPGLDPDPRKAIDLCLDIAADHGKPVDMHIDEWLHVKPSTLELLADAVIATGFEHGVTASHCVSLGMLPAEHALRVSQKAAAARLSVICLPQTNLYLQGRDHATATPRGLTAVKALREAGVNVAAGADNMQDPFNLLGRGDPLETAALLMAAAHQSAAQALASVTDYARQALGLPVPGIAAGARADLLAIKAGSVREAIASADTNRVVIRAGRLVARTNTRHDLADELTDKGDGHLGRH